MKKIKKTLQTINFEPNNATIITRNHSVLNFGQTGLILGFNEFRDEVVFKAHGDDKTYNLHYTQLWLQTDAHNYQDRNKALEFLTKNNL